MNISSGMASIRARNKNERFMRAVTNTVEALRSHPCQSVRVSTKLAKYVLLSYKTLAVEGKMYSTQVRNVGAGVQELYLVRKTL